MLETIQNAFKIEELRNRMLFVLLMLVVFRVAAHVPTPGIDSAALASFFQARQGTILSFFDVFSGGALSRLTVVALGITPYISASIIIQLLTVVFPYLERLSREGEAGRRKITMYTRYGTIGLGILQGFGIAVGLQSMSSPQGASIVLEGVDPWGFRIITVITLTAGTAFLMWIGEQINERGIGNGISLIIFAGIVASIPGAGINTLQLAQAGELPLGIITFIGVIMVIVIFAVIFMETAQRRIAVQYAKRMQGSRMYGGQSANLPLKINSAGVIPPIFASSILAFPATIVGFAQIPWMQSIATQLQPTAWLYNILFVGMIFFFCYFYTAIQFNPVKISDEMKRYGGYVPGIRPGRKTAEYINQVLTRITFVGALYLSAVCVLPVVLFNLLNVPFLFGGTSLLIIVGVALDTVRQIEAFMLNRSYDGFMRKGKKRYTGTRQLRI